MSLPAVMLDFFPLAWFIQNTESHRLERWQADSRAETSVIGSAVLSLVHTLDSAHATHILDAIIARTHLV